MIFSLCAVRCWCNCLTTTFVFGHRRSSQIFFCIRDVERENVVLLPFLCAAQIMRSIEWFAHKRYICCCRAMLCTIFYFASVSISQDHLFYCVACFVASCQLSTGAVHGCANESVQYYVFIYFIYTKMICSKFIKFDAHIFIHMSCIYEMVL